MEYVPTWAVGSTAATTKVPGVLTRPASQSRWRWWRVDVQHRGAFLLSDELSAPTGGHKTPQDHTGHKHTHGHKTRPCLGA